MTLCSYCGAQHEAGSLESWSISDQAVSVFKPRTALACIDSGQGELWICENCYKKNAFRALSPNEKTEIHYQMALEYQSRSEYAPSIMCLKEVLRHRKSADALATLALSFERIGKGKMAERFYLQAIKLDRDHLMANENLKRLTGKQRP
jgi:tetratricopeptide (TPR) repeat protein